MSDAEIINSCSNLYFCPDDYQTWGCLFYEIHPHAWGYLGIGMIFLTKSNFNYYDKIK